MIGIRLAAVMAALAVVCAPAVALAGVEVPQEPEALTSWAIIVAGYVLAGALIVSRYAPILKPLSQRLPAKWRWVPEAVGVAAMVLQTGLPSVTTAQGALGVLLTAGMAAYAVYTPGAKSPDDDEPKTKTSGVMLGGLLCALPLALLGCQPPHSAADVERATVVGYSLAVEVVEATDDAAVSWIESLDEPTDGELEAADRIADTLVKARELLVEARDRLLEGQDILDQLRDAVVTLSDGVTLLVDAGVPLPSRVLSSLQTASELLGETQ